MSMMVAFVAALIAFQVPVRHLGSALHPGCLSVSLVLLILVLGVGRGVNGAKRWISLGS